MLPKKKQHPYNDVADCLCKVICSSSLLNHTHPFGASASTGSGLLTQYTHSQGNMLSRLRARTAPRVGINWNGYKRKIILKALQSRVSDQMLTN